MKRNDMRQVHMLNLDKYTYLDRLWENIRNYGYYTKACGNPKSYSYFNTYIILMRHLKNRVTINRLIMLKCKRKS